MKWYQKAAEQDYAEAQFRLGECYWDGSGVEKNTEEAIKWYRKAAELGDLRAQTVLGICYCEGVGVEKDIELGHRYLNSDGRGTRMEQLQKAAERGYAEAQYELRANYLLGVGRFEENSEEAVKWLQKAAEQGHEKALKALEYIMES